MTLSIHARKFRERLSIIARHLHYATRLFFRFGDSIDIATPGASERVSRRLKFPFEIFIRLVEIRHVNRLLLAALALGALARRSLLNHANSAHRWSKRSRHGFL